MLYLALLWWDPSGMTPPHIVHQSGVTLRELCFLRIPKCSYQYGIPADAYLRNIQRYCFSKRVWHVYLLSSIQFPILREVVVRMSSLAMYQAWQLLLPDCWETADQCPEKIYRSHQAYLSFWFVSHSWRKCVLYSLQPRGWEIPSPRQQCLLHPDRWIVVRGIWPINSDWSTFLQELDQTYLTCRTRMARKKGCCLMEHFCYSCLH